MSDQLTLDQAATEYSLDCFVNTPEISVKNAFKAGAEWEKEQTKELINLMRQLIVAYSYRHTDTKQLLVGYTNEQAIDKMNTLLERLQD